MSYKVNNTSQYHINEMETLGWELTVCNTLEPKNNPCRDILINNTTFGNLLYDYLKNFIHFNKIKKIIEIGGGYGFIMRDILKHHSNIDASMLDISRFLLNKQKSTLSNFNVKYFEKDFFDTKKSFLEKFDIAILNENIGDFPTICNITTDLLNNTNKDNILTKIYSFIEKYSLKVDKEKPFNFNLGALETVEKLCDSGIKYIYISEHSCEAQLPDKYKEKIDIDPTGDPEKISLKGHDEYTIKFSFLEKVAKQYNYKTIRGNFTDFIKFNPGGKINFILTSNTGKDEHEIIRLFLYDLFKYEYLLLIKE